MTFNDAIQHVIGGGMVKRCYQESEDNYGSRSKPYSSWIRIRLDGEKHDDRSLLIIESANFDKRTDIQLGSWIEDFLSVADIKADDWEGA
jgi:hypothetical protein